MDTDAAPDALVTVGCRRVAPIGFALLIASILAMVDGRASPVGDAEFRHALHTGMTKAEVIRIAGWFGGCIGVNCPGIGNQFQGLQVSFIDRERISACSADLEATIYMLRFDSRQRLISWVSPVLVSMGEMPSADTCRGPATGRPRPSPHLIPKGVPAASPSPFEPRLAPAGHVS